MAHGLRPSCKPFCSSFCLEELSKAISLKPVYHLPRPFCDTGVSEAVSDSDMSLTGFCSFWDGRAGGYWGTLAGMPPCPLKPVLRQLWVPAFLRSQRGYSNCYRELIKLAQQSLLTGALQRPE